MYSQHDSKVAAQQNNVRPCSSASNCDDGGDANAGIHPAVGCALSVPEQVDTGAVKILERGRHRSRNCSKEKHRRSLILVFKVDSDHVQCGLGGK